MQNLNAQGFKEDLGMADGNYTLGPGQSSSLVLQLKLQYFGRLKRRASSLGKTLMLVGKG